MRVGIIGNSGASALRAAVECSRAGGLNIKGAVVTDRDCGLESWARANGFDTIRIAYSSPETFSADSDAYFNEAGCDDVLLFYTRRVARPLIDNRRVWNIHPALLPSFRGLHGVRDARRAGVKLFGATLHRVDEGLDTGPIDAQICSPMPEATLAERADRVSYIHKVWLTLVWFETIAGARSHDPVIYPWNQGVFLASAGLISSHLKAAFTGWLDQTERRNLG